MPRYSTESAHDLGQTEATERLKAHFDTARSFSDLEGSWNENAFTFSVSVQGLRLKGVLLVQDDSVKLNAQMPFVAMPFAGWTARFLKHVLARPVPVDKKPPVVETIQPDSDRGDSPRITPAAPTVLFLHLPKAGGTTLGDYIYNQCRAEEDYDEDLLKAGVLFLPYGFFKSSNLSVPEYILPALRRTDLRAVIGHFWYGIHARVDRPSTYVTILRNPVDRIVSLYYFLKLEDRMSMEEFVSSPPFKEVDNDQTRRIAGVDPEIGGCTETTLLTAQENLRKHFSVVGTVERYDETVVLLKRRFGWTRTIVPDPKNVNPNRPPTVSLSQKVLAAIRKRNELDFELYQYAERLLDQAISAEGREFHDELGKYKMLRPEMPA